MDPPIGGEIKLSEADERDNGGIADTEGGLAKHGSVSTTVPLRQTPAHKGALHPGAPFRRLTERGETGEGEGGRTPTYIRGPRSDSSCAGGGTFWAVA